MRKSLNILLLIVLMVSLLGNFLPADAARYQSIKAVFSNIKIFVDGKALETSQEPLSSRAPPLSRCGIWEKPSGAGPLGRGEQHHPNCQTPSRSKCH